jgi:hypothetical protein
MTPVPPTVAPTPAAGEEPTVVTATPQPSFVMENADDVSDEVDEPGKANGALRHLRVENNKVMLIRFITKAWLTMAMHFGVKVDSDTRLSLGCNGPGCALCLAGLKAVVTHHLPVFSVDEADVCIITLYRDSGAGSLRAQVLSLLRQANYLDLVVGITKSNWRYTAKIVKVRDTQMPGEDGAYLGDDILRDYLARGGFSPEDVAATVERRPNQVLLADVPGLVGRIKLLHPTLDVAKL